MLQKVDVIQIVQLAKVLRYLLYISTLQYCLAGPDLE